MLSSIALSLVCLFQPLVLRVPSAASLGVADELPKDVTIEEGSSRAWAMMACSVPAVRDNFRQDLLAGATLGEKNVATLREALKLKWEITGKETLVAALERLLDQTDRADIARGFREVRQSKLTEKDLESITDVKKREELRPYVRYAKRMEKDKNGLLGYDYVKAITVCRYGYGAGYLTEDEVWKRIDPIARTLQKTYGSWQALGEIYAIGEHLVDPHLAEKTWATFEQLKSDEHSMWKTLGWNHRLAPLDKPEKPAPKK